MSWVRLDDQFLWHPKVMAAGPEASWLYVCGLCYASQYLTDGFIPEGMTRRLTAAADPEQLAERLVAVGLWEATEGGYRIHDYLDYQPAKSQVLAEREIARRRAVMNSNPQLIRAVRARDGDLCRYCSRRVAWQDRKSAAGGTYDHVVPVSQGGAEAVDNLVTCCRACNLRKGARTPEQAGMTLQPVSGLHITGTTPESHSNQAGIKPESGPESRLTSRIHPVQRSRSSSKQAPTTDRQTGAFAIEPQVLTLLGRAGLQDWEHQVLTQLAAQYGTDDILAAVGWAKQHAHNASGVLRYAAECIRDAPWEAQTSPNGAPVQQLEDIHDYLARKAREYGDE